MRLGVEKQVAKMLENKSHTAYLLALLGATDRQIAEVMCVDRITVERWKRDDAEFLAELNKGKLVADTKVVEAFFKCATGYYYEEDHVCVWKGKTIVTKVKKYRPPDPWSCARWLSLRQRGKWSESQRVEITNTNINVNKLDLTGVTNEQLRLLRDIGLKQLTENAGDSH